MRTEALVAMVRRPPPGGVPRLAILLYGALVLAAAMPAARAAEEGGGAAWTSWHADNDVANLASLQRGARNFTSYCLGCHSLKYMRWSRLGTDLQIPPDVLEKELLPPGVKAADYIQGTMPAAAAETWFGKAPPDLSLMARARGRDYLFQFLKTFYVDPARQTGVNNMRFPLTAMPHVLSDLEGLKRAVYKTEQARGPDGQPETRQVFDHFEQVAPGHLTEAEYDGFVRDTVNFLDYVGEPTQTARRSIGVWTVLFLLVFTWLAWLMKKEYWKDVH